MSTLSGLFTSTAMGGDLMGLMFFTTATVWTAQVDCTVVVHAFGGSGSGGGAYSSIQSGTSGPNATGGGAGARCSKKIKMKAGESLTMTPGAGGAGFVVNTPTTFSNGNDGGDTTVTGPGVNMVAGGGKGGKAVLGGTNALLGGAGGVATGGDENVTGGRGGNLIAGANVLDARATGGGALPIFGQGYRGGDILVLADDSATGGGGIGGRGGDITGSTASQRATGGGGAAGDAPDQTTNTGAAVPGGAGKAVGSVPLAFNAWVTALGTGATGEASSSPAFPGPDGGLGGGSGGTATFQSSQTCAGRPGLFAGGGGAMAGSHANNQTGVNLFYGATGGVACAGNATVAKGGDGFIVLEVY